MWVKNYMLKEAHTITADGTMADAVKLMVEKKTNSLIVVDGDMRPVGIVSSYTLLKETVPAYLKDNPVYSQYDAESVFGKYATRVKNKKIGEIMAKAPHALAETDTMIEAAAYALEASRRTLPVVNKEGRLVGVVTRTGIKLALHDAMFGRSETQ